MIHRSIPILKFAMMAILLLVSPACYPTNIGAPIAPTIPPGIATIGSVPTAKAIKSPPPSEAAPEPTLVNAASCDRMSFIEITAGSAQTTPFSDTCATDCIQTISFKNNSPTEVIKLIFFEDMRCRPDQGCLNGQRWFADYILTPGDSIERVQFNRTPHSGECPWSANDYSLVGAIPTGSQCNWVLENPETSQLPFQEIENQCR